MRFAVVVSLLFASLVAAQELGRIEGRAFDLEADRPIVGALVLAVREDVETHPPRQPITRADGWEALRQRRDLGSPLVARTDEDGRYLIPAVPPARYTVTLIEEDGVLMELAGLVVPAGGAALADFAWSTETNGCWTLVLLDAERRPLAEREVPLQVRWRRAGGSSGTRHTSGHRTDALGRILVPLAQPGFCAVTIDSPEFGYWSGEVTSLQPGGVRSEVQLGPREEAVAAMASISGTVVRAADGQPLAGLQVSATRLFDENSRESGWGTVARTADDGSFTIRELPAGRYNVSLGAGGPTGGVALPAEVAPPRTEPIDLAKGQRLEGVALRLPPATPVQVTVTDEATGNAIDGAHVSLVSRRMGPLAGHCQTDNKGQAELQNLPAGRHRVQVSAPGYQTAEQEIEVVIGGEPPMLEVTLTRVAGAR